MKLYLHTGRYYEKQADCPDRKFETVEFPFAASPKADFVAWLNEQEPQISVDAAAHFIGDAVQSELTREASLLEVATENLARALPVDQRAAEQAAKPAPTPSQPRPVPTGDGVIEWLLNDASPAEVENTFTALGARFHEMRGAA